MKHNCYLKILRMFLTSKLLYSDEPALFSVVLGVILCPHGRCCLAPQALFLSLRELLSVLFGVVFSLHDGWFSLLTGIVVSTHAQEKIPVHACSGPKSNANYWKLVR